MQGTASEVRIVGGQWKRTRIPVLAHPGLRPTPDRVRETLFNWLGDLVEGAVCCDAFAGTGALGLEAASRGAARVTLVEADARVAAHLRQQVQRLGSLQRQDGRTPMLEVVRGDGVAALRRCAVGSLDLVLLDPPFAAELHAAALDAARAALAPSGRVYLEAPEAWSTERLQPLGWTLLRHTRAGAVHAHVLALATVPAG